MLNVECFIYKQELGHLISKMAYLITKGAKAA